MSIKINKNNKEYDLGFVPQSLYDDVEDLKDAMDTTELTVTPANGTIQAGSVKRKDDMVVINLRYVSTSATAVGDTIITLPYNVTSNIAHVQLCNNKNYAIDLLLNKIRTNSAIASGETIIISGVVFVES